MSFTPFPAQLPPQEITDLTEKLVPVGADEILISDSEDSNAAKKVQLDNVTKSKNAEVTLLDVDWSTAEVFYKDVSANTTFTFSNVQQGKTIIVIVNNTAVGTVTVDFPTALKASGFSGDIDASNESVFTFVASNSKVYATSVANMV